MKGPMVTVNWKGKENSRGLSETAIESLNRVGIKLNKSELISASESLQKEYFQMCALSMKPADKLGQKKFFTLREERDMVSKYVNIKV